MKWILEPEQGSYILELTFQFQVYSFKEKKNTSFILYYFLNNVPEIYISLGRKINFLSFFFFFKEKSPYSKKKKI